VEETDLEEECKTSVEYNETLSTRDVLEIFLKTTRAGSASDFEEDAASVFVSSVSSNVRGTKGISLEGESVSLFLPPNTVRDEDEGDEAEEEEGDKEVGDKDTGDKEHVGGKEVMDEHPPDSLESISDDAVRSK
jgi:hypothetical protein